MLFNLKPCCFIRVCASFLLRAALYSEVLFQQLDIDYVVGDAHDWLGAERKAQGASAILRIFGVTAGGFRNRRLVIGQHCITERV